MNASLSEPVVPRASFECSAARSEELPSRGTGEYCLLGRSNVGKSSFLNHLFADNSLAKVSSRPGKTVLINLFSLQSGERWVDLPGYGYAQVAKGEQRRIAGLLDAYLTQRKELRGVIWLLDSRHVGLAADRDVAGWLLQRDLPVLAVLTKCDKLSRSACARALDSHARILHLSRPAVVYSIREQRCRFRFWEAYCRWRDSAKEL